MIDIPHDYACRRIAIMVSGCQPELIFNNQAVRCHTFNFATSKYWTVSNNIAIITLSDLIIAKFMRNIVDMQN